MNEFIPHDLAPQIRERGWIHLRGAGTKASLVDQALYVGKLLGDPMPGRQGRVIETLVPTPSERANPKSLSNQHGIGAFPLHIDGAHRLWPPHFILLACERPGSTPVPTVLARFSDLQSHIAERGQCESVTFLIRNGRQSFYSTIIDRARPFVRFDPGCMTPICANGQKILATIALWGGDVPTTAVNWQRGDILVIDNWRVLHGRGTTKYVTCQDRSLLRVSIQ